MTYDASDNHLCGSNFFILALNLENDFKLELYLMTRKNRDDGKRSSK